MLKYLDHLRGNNCDDTTLLVLATKAYHFYEDKSVSVFTNDQTEHDNYIISVFIRFFKCINSSKALDKDFFDGYIKNDIFKGKPLTIDYVTNCINSIKATQATRLLFEVTDVGDSLKQVPAKQNGKGKNIKKVVNFEYKLEVVVSNLVSNKVLVPQIYFIFTFDDGTTLKTQIGIRLFNEFRKNLALNIKKIIQNESVPLLK